MVLRLNSAPQQEIPYEPPNIGNSASSSPDPVNPSNRKGHPQGKLASDQSDNIVTFPYPGVAKTISGNDPSALDMVLPMGQSVTKEDKYELAKFLVEHPKGTLGFKKHIETFRKTVCLANSSSASC